VIDDRECLLSFGSECFVLQVSIQNINIKIYKNIILPVVLYGCETWSLMMWEECRLRLHENSVLRTMFGSRGTR